MERLVHSWSLQNGETLRTEKILRRSSIAWPSEGSYDTYRRVGRWGTHVAILDGVRLWPLQSWFCINHSIKCMICIADQVDRFNSMLIWKETESQTASATIFAQETVFGQACSNADFTSSMTSNDVIVRFGGESFSAVLSVESCNTKHHNQRRTHIQSSMGGCPQCIL